MTQTDATSPLLEAARREPANAAARAAYATALLAAERFGDARDELLDALSACGSSATLWWRLAAAQAALASGGDAYASLQKALEAGPVAPADWYGIGTTMLQLQRFDEALEVLRMAVRAAPDEPAALRRLAEAEHAAAEDEAALALRARLRRSAPDDLDIALAHALQLPLIPASTAAARQARSRYAQGLAEVRSDLDRWRKRPEQVFALRHEHFLLAYQGEDDLSLQREYSELVGSLAAQARPAWCAPRPLRWNGERRLRIGFASSAFYDCTAGRYFEQWVTGLDGARFERFVYHLGAYSDAFTARIAASCERFAALRPMPEALAARFIEDALDILVYPEIGMTPALHVLATLRLAPIQLAGWGHPVTTGSAAIDGYFTAAAMEPPDGASHYVETLLPLPGLGVRYAMPEPVVPYAREELRLPARATVYACPQSLFKIHPEMDGLFAQVLKADPDAVLVFFQGLTRGSTERFGRRLQQAFAAQGVAPRGQVKFMPRMAGEGFRRVLATCDLVLDTVRWSGGNTSLDAFSAGTPVLTLPGRFMRGRQTAAMLGIMGLEALVCESEAGYVERAHELAHDAAALSRFRGEIAERRAALFDRPEPLQAFEAHLLRLAAEAADRGQAE